MENVEDVEDVEDFRHALPPPFHTPSLITVYCPIRITA